MPTVAEYRGSKEFYLVLRECIGASQRRDKLYYKNIAEVMPDVPPQGHKLASETGAVLDAVSREMDENGLPMISALVVRTSDEKPGPGFYKLAHQLGKINNPETLSPREKEDFWRDELEQVYEFWDEN